MDFYHPPSIQGLIETFSAIYRALRAWKFYPKGHPSRKISVRKAYTSLLSMLDGNTLSLSCGRTGFSLPDGEKIRDTSGLTAPLAFELFIRRIQKITILKDIYQEDLLAFLRILAMTPENIQQLGGFDLLMAERGIRTIWINEFDLSVIGGKRREIEAAGIIPEQLDTLESETGLDASLPLDLDLVSPDAINPAEELRVLIGRLNRTGDADIYLMHVRQSIACSDLLKTRQELAPLLPLVEILADHAIHKECNIIKDCARFGLEQLSMGDEFQRFVLATLETGETISKDSMVSFLKAAGSGAVNRAVEHLGKTDNLTARKSLATLLISLGESAVPSISAMLSDKRWYIVRNLCTILGEIRSQESVQEIEHCLHHSDIRVCKEAIRAMAKIGGIRAETALITVLKGNDHSLLPQAIASLGGMKSRKSLTELLHILTREDMFLNSLPLKIDALTAISMIGDRQVSPLIMQMLDSRHFVSRSRWKQLKVAIAACLGRLGETRALPMLKKLASDSGELGRASAEALEMIERTEKE